MKRRARVRAAAGAITPAQKIFQNTSVPTLHLSVPSATSGHDYPPDIAAHGATGIGLGGLYTASAPYVDAGQMVSINSAAANGCRVVYGLNAASTTPRPNTSGVYAAGDQAAYSSYVTNVATTLAGKAYSLQLRNESMGFLGVQGELSEAAVAYPLIKAADSSVLVCATADLALGGTAGITTNTPALMAGSGGFPSILTNCDMFNAHLYQNGAPSPEAQIQNEGYYVFDQVHQVTPTFPVCIGETGWQTTNPAGTFYATETVQGQYIARMCLLGGCLPYLRFVNIWDWRGDDAYGMNYSSGPTIDKLSVAFFHNTAMELKNWVGTRVAYTRPGVSILTTNVLGVPNANRAGEISTNPLYIRGNLVSGKARLFVWHPTDNAYSDQIFVHTGTAGNLNIMDISNGSVTTSALSVGYNTLNITLTNTPKLLYRDDAVATFPEFQS